MNINKEILKTIKYFSFFAYYPTLTEIHTFLRVKVSKKEIKYTPPQYGIKRIKSLELKIKNSKKKLNNWRFRAYIKLLSFFPQIKLVGLSGSISMMNAEENDDIDLFVITAKNRLFSGRLIALVLAQMLGLRRSRKARSSNNKVCLNLFFDESDLKVPKFKQTEFVGHEVLQMKPIVVKGNIYERFLEANLWVFKLFPNAGGVFSIKYKVSSIRILNTKYLILDTISNWLEVLLKNLQLKLINCHRTTEIITSTQLWFHPEDYNSFM